MSRSRRARGVSPPGGGASTRGLTPRGRARLAYSSSLIGSRSSRMYIGRPVLFGNVCDGSMPMAR